MRVFTCITLCLVFSLTHAAENMGRLYINPFNGNALDLWILVQEDAVFLNNMRYSQIRSFISDIIKTLNIPGSSSRFSVGFFGANNQTRWVVTPGTSDAILAMSMLSKSQYVSRTPANGSLLAALNEFEIGCNSTLCRNNVPRVLLIMGDSFNDSSVFEPSITIATTETPTTNTPDVTTTDRETSSADESEATDPTGSATDLATSSEAVLANGHPIMRQNLPLAAPSQPRTVYSTLRKLEVEKLVTAMVMGVGAKEETVFRLASNPGSTFGVAVDSVGELNSLISHVVSLIREVPRFVEQNTRLTFPNARINDANIMLINVGNATKDNEGLVALTLKCQKCNVFASSNYPRPTMEISEITRPAHNVTGFADTSMYYFKVKQGTTRLFLNIDIQTMGTTEAWINIFPLPSILSESVVRKVKKAEFPVLRFNAESSA